jgi:hypothetical protein
MDADVESLFSRVQLTGPDMLIDGYDQYNEQENEVVNISPDEASEEPTEPIRRADDCMSPFAIFSTRPLMQIQLKP